MATVIDSLIVKLGLDATGFEKGQKQVDQSLDKTRKRTDKVGKDIAASGKQAAEFFGQLERAALKFFAAITLGRGLAEFTRTVIQGGAQLDRMSGRLGESAANLSKWQGAVRQSGGTGEGFLSTVQGISAEMTRIKQTGESSILPFLSLLGVSLVDTNGRAKSTVDLLDDIGNALDSKKFAAADKFNILQQIGIDEGTANFLLRSQSERQQILSAQKAYSDADAKTAREAAEAYEAASLRIERSTQVLVIKLVPAFEALTSVLVSLVEGDLADKLGISDQAQSKIGESVAYVLSAFGNDEAVAAVRASRAAEAANDAGPMPTPITSPGRRASRAERNNNPGNLEYRGQAGATPEPGSGRFASFKTSGEGVAALVRQLQKYGERGLDTVAEIIGKYAPANENDTQAYISALSKRLGVGANDVLDLSNSGTLSALVRGISTHEAGSDYLSGADIMTGLRSAGVSGGQSSSVSIGEVKVYTQATDANGIARDIRGALVRQADTGMR